jgi:hypothetical protein
MREGNGMRLRIPYWPLLAMACSPLVFAAVDGTVINGTTGKPQPGVSVTLVKPGQKGMETIGTTTSNAQGHFAFENTPSGGGPQLLQGNYKSVNYNKMLTPDVPTNGVELQVFEASKSPALAKVAQHMLVVEPSANQIGVSETIIVQNEGKTTYSNDELGGVRFYLPSAAKGQVSVSVKGPGGMPLPRSATETEEKGVYKVAFAIKPGETEFDLSYVVPATDPVKFEGHVVGIKGQPAGPLRLVAPNGVTLEGADLRKLGQEPKSQATIYDVTATGPFTVDVQGLGSLRGGDDAAAQTDTSDAPQIESVKPPVYRYLPALIGLALGILGLGLVILYRSSPVRADP